MALARWPGITGVIASLSLFSSTAIAGTYINDPLTSSTYPGRGSKGGTFSSNGWTTTNAPTDPSQDSVWYEVPDALPSGSVQVTVTGVSIGGNFTGNDHELLCIYAAPSGEAEPIAYNPAYRDNDFKAFIRIFGSAEPAPRPGAMKLELAECPRGDPWYHALLCPTVCDHSGIAYAGGQATDIGWDPSTAYTLKITWSPGLFTLSRNGTEVGRFTFSGTYAPPRLRVRIGSPRNDGVYPGSAFMPAGLTFRDLVVEGTPGTPTPICQPPADDAGTAGASSTDGGTSNNVSVIQDVTGASWETGVFPDVNDLNVEALSDGTPSAVVYLRFPPVGPVKKAVLTLHAQAYASAAGGSGVICRVDNDTWQETTLTWANRPGVSSTCAGASTSVDPDTDISWDVTSLIAASGDVNLAIVSSDPDGAHFLSKEGGTAATRPRLTIWPAPVSETGGSAGTGGGGGSATGGGTGWDVSPLDAGGSDASEGDGGPIPYLGGAFGADSGCGCRMPAGSAPGWLGGGALALLFLVRRRRARRVARRTPESGG